MMMAEMLARGPIACTIAVTTEFESYTTGIFNDTTGAKVMTTCIIHVNSCIIHVALYM